MLSQRRRALPAWMKRKAPSTTNSDEGELRSDHDLATCSSSLNGTGNVNKRVPVDTIDDDSDKEVVRIIKKRILDQIDTFTDEGDCDIQPANGTFEKISEDSTNVQDQENQQSEKNSSPSTARRFSDDESNTLDAKTPKDSAHATRKSCYYGSSCYRKNPQHRLDLAHPGDPDYCDGTKTSSDNRPLCEYGSACYRKNPQHLQDFSHDGPKKRKARPAGMHDIPSDDDGDFNESIDSDDFKPEESESDESFVTSDSLSSGNSDYDPDDDNNDDDGKERKKKMEKKKKEDKAKGKRKKASG